MTSSGSLFTFLWLCTSRVPECIANYDLELHSRGGAPPGAHGVIKFAHARFQHVLVLLMFPESRI